jgi:crotonobetainyl-CoA:carnitine CoA-transferase CaiB-like acyl-CoA transferase
MINSFFKDLKVIELASVLAGPAVGMFFSELGAEVIKIENKMTDGDITRRWKLPTEDPKRDYSAYYCSVNWNKKSILLDLKNKADRERVYEQIKTADIVISNFKSGSGEKIGMDYKTLKAINSRIIFAQITAFGENDKKPAFDIVLQAETGFLYMTGEAGREPVRMPVALIDLLAAHQLKEAILIALLHRERTGKGSFVSTSLFDSAVASLANQATNWLMEGYIPQRMGSAHPNISPYGDIFYTKDNKLITLAVGTEKQFKTLCDCLEKPALSEDKRFETNVLRVENRISLKTELEKLIDNFKRKELNEMFEKRGVPAGNINNMKEVFELPQTSRMILEEKKADGKMSKRVRTVAFNVKL